MIEIVSCNKLFLTKAPKNYIIDEKQVPMELYTRIVVLEAKAGIIVIEN